MAAQPLSPKARTRSRQRHDLMDALHEPSSSVTAAKLTVSSSSEGLGLKDTSSQAPCLERLRLSELTLSSLTASSLLQPWTWPLPQKTMFPHSPQPAAEIWAPCAPLLQHRQLSQHCHEALSICSYSAQQKDALHGASVPDMGRGQLSQSEKAVMLNKLHKLQSPACQLLQEPVFFISSTALPEPACSSRDPTESTF